MNRWPLVLTLATFLTVAASGCGDAVRSTAPALPHYDTQQTPPTDSTGIPDAGTQSDTTGRGGGFLGSGT